MKKGAQEEAKFLGGKAKGAPVFFFPCEKTVTRFLKLSHAKY